MATKIAQNIESLVEKKANPISMKWQDDEPPTKETTTQLDRATNKEVTIQQGHKYSNKICHHYYYYYYCD